MVVNFGRRDLIGNKIKVYKPAGDELSKYTGDYYSYELDVTYTFFIEEDNLYLKFRNNPRINCDLLKKNEVLIERIGKALLNQDDRNNITDFVLEAGRAKNLKFVKQ